MSSPSSSAAGLASTDSGSDSSMASTSTSESTTKIACLFDPRTCQQQFFSIPEKIVYYIAKNPTNGETFAKLVETCKYFYGINPVFTVQKVECDDNKWYAYYGVNGENRVGFKYDQPINFKIWVTHEINCSDGDASKVIPSIYKNDATFVRLESKPLKLEEFLFLAGNTKELAMFGQLVKYESGDIVQLEDIVKNLPKVQSFTFFADAQNGVNNNTASKLIQIEHIKNITRLVLWYVPEELNVEQMFNYMIENKQIKVDLRYRHDIPDEYKEVVREYSLRLKTEEGCNSKITFGDVETTLSLSSPQSSNFDLSFDSSGDDETEDLLFPWNNEEEEWELPWDKPE